MRFIAGVMMAVVLLAFASPLVAEDKPVDDSADSLQLVINRIKSEKKLLVVENMQLTEKEAKSFWPLYEKYQSELFLLRMRTVQLIKDYEASYEKMTDSTAKKLLDEGMRIETLRMKLNKAYLPQFRKILPDTKVVRYFQIESKVNAIINYDLAIKIPLLKAQKTQQQ